MVQRYARHMLQKNDSDFVNSLSVVVTSPCTAKKQNSNEPDQDMHLKRMTESIEYLQACIHKMRKDEERVQIRNYL